MKTGEPEWTEEPLFDVALPEPPPVSIRAVQRSLRPHYTPLTTQGRTACARCQLDVHEGHVPTGFLARSARVVRTIQATGERTPLCYTHAEIFKKADGV